MKKQYILLAFSLLLFFSMMLGGVLAQSRMPGVKVGDTFKYTYTIDLDIDGDLEFLPEMFDSLTEQIKNIEWSQITISQVSGTSVTAQVLTHFKNGTNIENTETTDVSTRMGDLSMFLVAANLNANDQIYQGSNYQKINETITKTYPSGTREVNHQNMTSDFIVSQEELEGFNITGPLQQRNSQNTYWDKQSGTLIEMTFVMVTNSQEVNANINAKVELVETSLYTIPEFSHILIVVFGLAATGTLAIKYKNQFKKH